MLYKASGSAFACIKNAALQDFYTNAASLESVVSSQSGKCTLSGIRKIYTAKQSGLNKKVAVGSSELYLGGTDFDGIPYFTVENILDYYSLDDGEISVEPVVSFDGSRLGKDTDYTVSIKNNLGETVSVISEGGIYTAVVEGFGDFTGSAEKNFSVLSASSSSGGGFDF